MASSPNLLPELVSIYTFTQGYPLDKLGTFSIGDTAWTYGAEPLILPVDAFQLGNPNYAVYSVTRRNEAGQQLGYAMQYGAGLRDPRNAVRDHPTRIDVTMRNIQSAGVLTRDYHAVAYVATSPRGIDLIGGGKP